jgi:hypothetical protein
MPIVRLPNGELRDEIRQPLYDTLSLGVSGASGNPNTLDNQQWFSNIQGKAQWQTNLRQPNLLETAVSFRVQGMALDAQYINTVSTASLPACLPSIMDYSSVRVRIGEKDYWTGPAAYLMGRIEQNAAIASTAATNTSVYQRAGAQAVQGVILSGRHVVDINPLQSFYAQLQVAIPTALAAATTLTGNDGVNLKFSFKGLMRRPVQ